MYKILLLCIFLIFSTGLYAQELDCQVIINAENTGQSNLSVFSTMQRALTEFINRTTWTDMGLKNEERINCSMFITINSFEGESFSGTIQIQSSRPVYGSSMISPVFNFNDDQFSFNYREYQPLNYSQNSYTNNLISVVSFYVYTILGLDADTFEKNGGTPYFEEAKRIVSTAQQGNSAGWGGNSGSNSRYQLNLDLLSNVYAEYRTTLYKYHRLGLDVMHKDLQKGKEAVAASVEALQEMNARRPNSLLLRVFFDAKADEISTIFSAGPKISSPNFKSILEDLAPRYTKNWRKLQ